MEIKFRGKRKDTNKWYYGSYLKIKGKDRDWTEKSIGLKPLLDYSCYTYVRS